MLFLCVFLLSCVGAWALLRMLRVYNLTRSVPKCSGVWPILGHGFELFGGYDVVPNLVKRASLEANNVDGVILLWLGPKPFYVITNPEIGYKVSNLCLEKNFIYRFASRWVGEGLITGSLPIWKRHRKLLNPTFNMQLLNGFMNIFNRQSQFILDNFEKNVGKEEFDHLPMFVDLGITTICQTAAGLAPGETPYFDQKQYSDVVNDYEGIILERTSNVALYLNFIYNLTNLRKREEPHVKYLRGLASTVMDKRKSALKNDNKDEYNFSAKKMKPFLDQLLDLQDQGLMTDEEVNDELNTIIAAGHDTTSVTLVVILYLLGFHQDVQEKVYKEIETELGTDIRDVEKQDLSKLVFMEAVIKESLRFLPTVPFILREPTEDVKLDNFTIPSGSSIVLSIWGMNKNKKFWGADAEVFDPERWTNPSRTPDHPGALASFSFGKRVCIGKTYSIMMMKVILVQVLRKFKIHARSPKLQSMFNVVDKPISGHHISVTRR